MFIGKMSGFMQFFIIIFVEKQKLRKTMFESPVKTIITNSYADHEFSDDDEDIKIIKEYKLDTSAGTSAAAAAKNRRTYNIPISHRAEERAKFSKSEFNGSRSMPTASNLMESTRTNSSILASSLINNAITKKSYSEIVRARSPLSAMTGGNILGGADDRASSICSSAASTCKSFYLLKYILINKLYS